jgi:hypothetical protein
VNCRLFNFLLPLNPILQPDQLLGIGKADFGFSLFLPLDVC